VIFTSLGLTRFTKEIKKSFWKHDVKIAINHFLDWFIFEISIPQSVNIAESIKVRISIVCLSLEDEWFSNC
jgi:hypothetical protein